VTEPEPIWIDVFLGEIRVGDSVRTKPEEVATTSRYANVTGTVVAIRNGAIAVRTGEDTVLFWPVQLERLDRPE
jgi:hypothetical protein